VANQHRIRCIRFVRFPRCSCASCTEVRPTTTSLLFSVSRRCKKITQWGEALRICPRGVFDICLLLLHSTFSVESQTSTTPLFALCPTPYPTPYPTPCCSLTPCYTPCYCHTPYPTPCPTPCPIYPTTIPSRPSSMPGAAAKHMSTAVCAPPRFLQWHAVPHPAVCFSYSALRPRRAMRWSWDVPQWASVQLAKVHRGNRTERIHRILC
jgi:hypothetical protein